jgi:hypothetical protein
MPQLRKGFDSVELAPGNGVAGHDLLDRVQRFLSRFIAYPNDAGHVAHVLWIGHAHRMDAWESTPRFAVLSPEPGSGKSRVLEVTELLVPRPVHAVNCTPSYLFRKVSDEAGTPTVLYDEIDTVFGPKAKENEDLRGLLNAGHRKGAVAGRCVVRGTTVLTEELPAYCAVALAGLNDLPDTIMTRSVVLRMRRRAPNEVVEPFRHREHAPEGHALRDALTSWSAQHIEAGVWPEMPVQIQDRNADVWEALLAVADAAGGDWPDRAREAAVTLVTDVTHSPPGLGVQLLADIRAVFVDNDVDALKTETLLRHLNEMEESPWGNIRGNPLDARGLARRLGRYEVKSKTIREGEQVFRGYARADLHDAWTRYLVNSRAGPEDSVTSVTSVTAQLTGLAS